MEEKFKPTIPYKWARRADNGYEVSTYGDVRFSALNAKLSDGRSIEEAYQLDVKGYRCLGSDWRLGKGKAPLIPTNELPKITSHYFELKNESKFNIFQDLIDLSNCCSKLICTDSTVKSIKDFIRIVKTEHKDHVNSISYDISDIVLCLIDPATKDISRYEYDLAMQSLVAAGKIGVLSFVTITRSPDLAYMNSVSDLANLIYPRYKEIPGTGYFVNLYEKYRSLWNQWILENMNLFEELAFNAHGKVLTDVYSNTDISQARALADILNNYYNLK